MTLKEAFKSLDETELVKRAGRPEIGSYQIKWLKQLLEWRDRREKILGSVMKKFIAEDALASDWELTKEYHFLGIPDFRKVENIEEQK